MKDIKTVKTAEEFLNIQSMGTWEGDYKNGELWSFNGKFYYLSPLELNRKELEIVLDCGKLERVG